MEGANAGEPVFGVGCNAVAGCKPVVMYALDFLGRNDYKPGVFVGIICVFLFEGEIAAGPELDFEVEQVAGLGALHHKIGHKTQGFAGGAVVVAQHGAQEGMNAFQSIVENVIATAVKQILDKLLGHPAFEGVEVEVLV